MKKLTFLVVVLIGFCLSFNVYGLDPKQTSEDFCSALSRGDVDEAYQLLGEGSPLMEKTQAVSILKTQTSSILAVYGAVVSYKMLREIKVEDDVIYFYYLLKTRDVPVCCEIVFYKAKDEWFLEKITFDDMCTVFRELYV